jgi:hypothetical protein
MRKFTSPRTKEGAAKGLNLKNKGVPSHRPH